MSAGRYIARREKQDNLYAQLRESSIALLQRLSGEEWTDFNAHDPGVTILEVLCGALEEVHYRLDFPLHDYLADPRTGAIPFGEMGLLPFDELLDGSVVTARDYEELMVSRLADVAGCRATFSKGLWDFTLCPAGDPDRGALTIQAARLYHANRNLCETLGEIRFGDVAPDTAAEPDATMEPDDETPQRVKNRPPFPHHRDIADHRPIRLDFPDCYGIGRHGLPAGASNQERARVLQLQAYLLIFDHLLAGVGRQAAALGAGFRLSGEIAPAGWPDIDAAKLIDVKKRGNSPRGSADFALRRQRSWMDTLDVLYGESTGEKSESPDERAALIRRMPQLNRRRFLSFDMLDSLSTPTAEQRKPCRVIEHLLLHPAGEVPEDELRKISLMQPAGSDTGEVSDRLPAHIAVEIREVPTDRWPLFEAFYRKWREALASSDPEKTKPISEELKRFLI